jgi:hypothetical protein
LAWQFDCRDKLKNPAAIPKELQITPICMALDPISLKPTADHIGGYTRGCLPLVDHGL